MRRICPVLAVIALTLVVAPVLRAGSVVSIYTSPGFIGLNPHSSQQFQVLGLDADGNTVPVTGSIEWQVDPSIGRISADGLFASGGQTGMFSDALKAVAPGGLTATASVCVFPATVLTSQTDRDCYYFSRTWGSFGDDQFDRVRGMGLDASQNLYVVDMGNCRILKYSSTRHCVQQWGSYGTAPGQFRGPEGLAVAPDGTIYVADYLNGRVQQFSQAGQLLGCWPVGGPGLVSAGSPTDVAVDQSGKVYVADAALHRIVKYDVDGNYVAQWGINGNAGGDFGYPSSVAVAPDGNVYVADLLSAQIEWFSPGGDLLGKWGTRGSSDGQFLQPMSMRIDGDGNVYVVDVSKRVQKFGPTGAFLHSWVVADVTQLISLALGSEGKVYACSTGWAAVHILGPDGSEIGQIQSDSGYGRLLSPSVVAVDSKGTVYVGDPGHSRIQEFSQDGDFLQEWGNYSLQKDGLSGITALAADSRGNVYVGSSGAIKRFDDTGHFICSWGSYNATLPDPAVVWPEGLAVDSTGDVWEVEANTDRVRRFTPDGVEVAAFTAKPGVTTSTHTGGCLAIDNSDNLYITDETSNVLQKYDSSGNLLLTINWAGGQVLSYPGGVAVDSQGNIYEVDQSVNGAVRKFSPLGTLIASWSFDAAPMNPMLIVRDVAVDADGDLYISDSGNDRILKLSRMHVVSSAGQVKGSSLGGEVVQLTHQIVTADSSEMGGIFYMESRDRSSGVRAIGVDPSRGTEVSATGALTLEEDEVVLQVSSLTQTGIGVVGPLTMNAADIGGGALGLQPRLVWPQGSAPSPEAMTGLNNVGLLVRTWGRVRGMDSDGSSFYLDDGSGHSVRCLMPAGVSSAPSWQFATVTGISSVDVSFGGPSPLVRVRTASDVIGF